MYWILPAMVPNGRLAMYQATVRRSCRVVNLQGSSPMRGMAGSPSERASRPSRNRLSVVVAPMPRWSALQGQSFRVTHRDESPFSLRLRAESASMTSTARATGSMVIQSAVTPRGPWRL